MERIKYTGKVTKVIRFASSKHPISNDYMYYINIETPSEYKNHNLVVVQINNNEAPAINDIVYGRFFIDDEQSKVYPNITGIKRKE